jgi:hypothetical protein
MVRLSTLLVPHWVHPQTRCETHSIDVLKLSCFYVGMGIQQAVASGTGTDAWCCTHTLLDLLGGALPQCLLLPHPNHSSTIVGRKEQ